MNAEEISPHLTATIVSSYVRHNTVGANQLSDLISTVYRAIGQLGQPVQSEEILVPAVSVRRSVHPTMLCVWIAAIGARYYDGISGCDMA
jgi:predicted transcriptional regulator